MANLRVDKITSTETFETTGSVQFSDAEARQCLIVSSSSDFAYGTGDFTIEGWVVFNSNRNAPSDGQRIFLQGQSGTTEVGLHYDFTNQEFEIDISGTGIQSISHNIDVGQWFHVALVRSNSTKYNLFIDGKLIGTKFASRSQGANNFIIGGLDWADNYGTVGHISNVRITKKELYTENFKPPMRELEVTPETVLLACQHKTDASHEKTGKTITVNGNAVANELTPGILTPVPKAGAGSAITGSVEFDGTGDYLELADSDDFDVGSGDFTFEFWVNPGRTTRQTLFTQMNSLGQNASSSFYVEINSSAQWRFMVQQSATSYEINAGTVTANEWTYLAYARNGNTATLYVNGVSVGTVDLTGVTVNNSSEVFSIGRYPGGLNFAGFISNFRMVKGTALYTDNFIPPTRELKKVPGTVLLCCQDENSVTTESTGKTITSGGDPAASNFTPQVGNDGSVEFVGPTKINTENYFYLPTGNTESRETTGSYSAGTRGVFGGGSGSPANFNTMNYVTISSTGDAQDFGDLTQARRSCSALASSVRGIFAGGGDPGANSNIIEFLTIASTGNTQDFGDLTSGRGGNPSTLASSTRGIVAGGYADPSPGALDINSIDYITISSKGNAQDFGDQLSTSYGSLQAGLSSPTRGVIAGTYAGGTANVISYITIATTGDAKDFGDLTGNRRNVSAAASSTRGLIFGGYDGSSATNFIDFVTIQSTGNALTFGDILSARNNGTSCSSQIRALAGGGGSNVNTIEYVTISTTSNALDFGDLTVGTSQFGSCSNGHGGLG